MESFNSVLDDMRLHGMRVPRQRVDIAIPNSQAVLRNALTYFLQRQGGALQWLPEYDRVAEWLQDNKGRGLFFYGDSGRGKSLLGRYVLPAILLKYCRKVVSVYDMQEANRSIDTVLSKHILSLDDVGSEEESVKYGERRLAFAEVMDAAEKYGKLVVVSSNLSAAAVKQMYGDRVVERIRATTVQVVFKGDSLRKKQ